ncbi:hypothetical protein SDC9_91589 [bioreactor metagenome]|uniref:AAA+ ATPase domain-containing protein n=1 Tax=bioreactor metagenome TaxID=1076179 RepID=A0A644ZVX4_9ZZZZ
MIIYSNTVTGFRDDVDNNRITDKLKGSVKEAMGRFPSDSEIASWNNSLRAMESPIRVAGLPGDCGILIEYNLPSTSKRIDFIITGRDAEGNGNFLIIELKQWSRVERTEVGEIFIGHVGPQDKVRTYTGGGMRDVVHPCYQAWSYKAYLLDMNEAATSGNIRLRSCAYLHNYEKVSPDPLRTERFGKLIEDTPLFLREDVTKLQDFLRRYVGQGKGMDILYEVSGGRIRPTRKLIDYVSEIMDGDDTFKLLDKQKVAHAKIVHSATRPERTTVIVNGGPGTGKSVVAINALSELLRKGLNVRFVAPNAAFRGAVEQGMGKKRADRGRLKAVISGSSGFWDADAETFDTIIVDEAHRLKRKGAYMYRGESQVRDVIKASRTNVFFVDDDQMIRSTDEGSVSKIKSVAEEFGSEVVCVELDAQFRCGGAEGFINWMESTLQIRDTGNFEGWDKEDFDFRIFDDPNTMSEMIEERRSEGHRARVLAGYAWKWTNKGNPDANIDDIVIEEHDFLRPWNSRSRSQEWPIDDSMENQTGCVHTVQGLEFDYIGVILGNDLRFDPETSKVYASREDYYDSEGKKGVRDAETLTKYVKNIYRILLSRGTKGCYIFCRDPELEKHLKIRSGNI